MIRTVGTASTDSSKGTKRKPVLPPCIRPNIVSLDCEMVDRGPKGAASTDASKGTKHKPVLPPCIRPNIVSLDCEMVGCGPKGRISALARCSIVDYQGKIIYDCFIKPIAPITDFRTKWSGIKRKDMVNATPFTEARKLIKKHLHGKYIIGHDLRNDFDAIKMSPHPLLIKDTSKCLALRHLAGLPEQNKPSLKTLTGLLFGKNIQIASHCSVEDARAALMLYKKVEDQWDTPTNPFLDDSYWVKPGQSTSNV